MNEERKELQKLRPDLAEIEATVAKAQGELSRLKVEAREAVFGLSKLQKAHGAKALRDKLAGRANAEPEPREETLPAVVALRICQNGIDGLTADRNRVAGRVAALEAKIRRRIVESLTERLRKAAADLAPLLAEVEAAIASRPDAGVCVPHGLTLGGVEGAGHLDTEQLRATDQVSLFQGRWLLSLPALGLAPMEKNARTRYLDGAK